MHFYRKMIIFVDKYDQGKDIMAGIGRGNAPPHGASAPFLPSRHGACDRLVCEGSSPLPPGCSEGQPSEQLPGKIGPGA